MILVDISQNLIANIMSSPDVKYNLEESLIKHMVITSLMSIKKKFGSTYGDLIICCDSKHYWRKEKFEHYKASRKSSREASDIDWKEIFRVINQTKKDLKENFPYKVIEVYGAEADDVIATLCKRATEKTLIVSSDKDYGQLHGNPLIQQYSPLTKEFIEIKYPEEFLREHIINGDRGDGIPNIRSVENSFVDKIRQKPITKKHLESWMHPRWPLVEMNFSEEFQEIVKRFEQNRELIDFNFIPEEIQKQIFIEFVKPIEGNKQKVMNYLMENRMRNLLREINDI